MGGREGGRKRREGGRRERGREEEGGREEGEREGGEGGKEGEIGSCHVTVI